MAAMRPAHSLHWCPIRGRKGTCKEGLDATTRVATEGACIGVARVLACDQALLSILSASKRLMAPQRHHFCPPF